MTSLVFLFFFGGIPLKIEMRDVKNLETLSGTITEK